MDIAIAPGNHGKMRRDWGLQNMIGMNHPNPVIAKNNAHNMQTVRRKVETFMANAVYPQQLCIPRQYSTTQEGVSVFQVIKGRKISGIQEDGVRVVVQENARLARFIMSPLFGNEHDARTWAKQQMGTK